MTQAQKLALLHTRARAHTQSRSGDATEWIDCASCGIVPYWESCFTWDRALQWIVSHVGVWIVSQRGIVSYSGSCPMWVHVSCGSCLTCGQVSCGSCLAWDHASQWTMPHVDRTKSTTMLHVGIMSYRESRHTWEIAPQKGDHTSRDKQPGAARQQMGLLAAYHGMPRNNYNT